VDTESIEVHAAEEVEEAREVPAYHDPSGLQAPRSSSSLGQDEQMAIGDEDRSALCDEPSVVPRINHLLYVLVLATTYGKDRFFLLEWEQLQDLVLSQYSAWLAERGNLRPKNSKSLHCSAIPDQLAAFENRWDKITERLA